ncbi:putative MFS-type transporter YhjX [Streptomyces sp. S4.7]|uniref:L-lactate MFS transporter n=1 Tax=Streptomyces sp. S4.7 TaxID=2705439 RepID=UPI001398097F|nr:OFA family MFS transporter [Streptomyces sp. S4.7]QHY99319.1 putative MFS-type transporter YhjX [Streptomyces sp. S4.7]
MTPPLAPVGWSRWLVPPAALSVHLSIGQAYAWSVFKPPLESALGLSGTQSALPFQLGIVMLGLSAAFGGTLVERNGPRWAMTVALVCFSSGFLLSALGAATEQFWLIVFGYGFVGGIGLGIGYISPVSTLIKWFPDRPGMATGIAIMGFGGGALIASPWSAQMLESFGSTNDGIAKAFLVHGLVYAVFMLLGVLLIRVPRPDAAPKAAAAPASALITTAQVSAKSAVRTPQFWLLWIVLCMNVTAGIGILEKAAPMITDFFADTDTPVSVSAAAGFVALLSAANMAGRIGWSSTSDLIGRKNTYRLYLGVGALMYLLIAQFGDASKPLFIICALVILSFYGGGFATVPAYLKDLFGTYQVGAIHGRLLTAWSAAGVLGPLIVNRVADSQEEAGKSGPGLYGLSLTIMIGLLVVGFVANELVRPVHPRHHRPADSTASATVPAPASAPANTAATKPEAPSASTEGGPR